MKSSSSKKYKSARRHSKLSLMRKKLTLKTRTSPVYCPKECEAANDTEEPNIQPGDDGHDEDNTEHNMDNTVSFYVPVSQFLNGITMSTVPIEYFSTLDP
jgi:hypothetical protein